jgi:hypothetical protein
LNKQLEDEHGLPVLFDGYLVDPDRAKEVPTLHVTVKLGWTLDERYDARSIHAEGRSDQDQDSTASDVDLGDRCVVRWTYRFHREEPERGHVRGIDVFRVRDGLVTEKLSYVKSEDFVRQLGLQIPRT